MPPRPFVNGERRDQRPVSLIGVPSSIVKETSQPIRYTATTCDPDGFILSGGSLRYYGRDTELFIAVTMSNENEVLFSRTMNSIMKSIAYLCSSDRSKTWDKDGWKKVIVCIISDGRNEANKQTLQLLAQMGCYKEEIAKNTVDGKPATAHIFERTLNSIIDTGETIVDVVFPIRVIFCLKEQKLKKLNSHRWFFNAFCPVINPKVCILLDVGTKPTSASIYELWRCFDENPRVGGACGEIVVDGFRGGARAAVHSFGQGISNIFHKPVEIGAFDYISFLPGAFSAYRYQAMSDNSYGPGPLAMYLKDDGVHEGIARAGSPERNVQFTEDQILFLEIVTKKGEAWTLRYVKSARAYIPRDMA